MSAEDHRGFTNENAAANVVEWFRNRSYHHEQFSDLAELGRLKRESGRSVSLVLPSRDVADTIGGILDEIHDLNERSESASARDSSRVRCDAGETGVAGDCAVSSSSR